MTMPGALLIGCDAGTINYAKIKGNHTAMKSGMIAAEAIAQALIFDDCIAESGGQELSHFSKLFNDSWLFTELYGTRNFGPVMHKFGTTLGGAYNTLDQNVFSGKLPFNFKDDSFDYAQLKPAEKMPVIPYPKPDNKLSFDKLSSVFLSNTNHEEEQPCHLKLTDSNIPIQVNLVQYNEPAQRYCPAGVYEVEKTEQGNQFIINAQNCIHCKTCDIKDPSQNITWVTPEGTGGPNYPNM
jgi:electron-transferring-flavoprotein dehydrogenase